MRDSKNGGYAVQPLVNGVQIIMPTLNETFNMTTVQVVAHATESESISQMQVWDNGIKLGKYSGADVNQYYSLSPGSHTVTVLDLDKDYNVIHQSSVTYSVK